MTSCAPRTDQRATDLPALTRRVVLGGAAAGAVTAGLTTAASAAPGSSKLAFALITDTHANVTLPERSAELRRLLEYAADLGPDVVLNAGDITDYGAVDEYSLYRSSIPARLADRIAHVPGNHEVRWAGDAMAAYRREFGDEWSSFSTGGVHFAGLAPMQALQEPGLFGDAGLDRVREILRDARDLPTVAFLHFPLGGANHYVNDTEEFYNLLDGGPVRAVLAGHVHRQVIVRHNGHVQLAARNTYAGPNFYWFERTTDGRSLTVTNYSVPATGEPVVTPVTSIPLVAERRDALSPVHSDARVSPDGDAIAVYARHPRGAPAAVEARVYPQGVFGGGSAGPWTALAAGAGGRWSGSLDATMLPPGEHRVQLRALSADGASYESTRVTDKRAEGVEVSWTQRLSGSVQGGLLPIPGGVVAATTSGQVAAVIVTPRSSRVLWSAQGAAALRAPALLADQVVVPTDGGLDARDVATGRAVWSADLGAPVRSSPVVSEVGGEQRVFVAAGTRLHCVTADGRVVWSADNHGFFAGRVACDSQRVYAGSGDGFAYAYDAATGEQRWRVEMTTRTTPYQRLIYGTWGDTVEVLPDGAVMFATVSNTLVVDPVGGAERWRRNDNHAYTPALQSEHGCLLINERGVPVSVDPASGAVRWTAPAIVPRSFEAGPVRDGDSALHIGTAGLLVRVALRTGAAVPLLQVTRSNTFSTPVLVESPRGRTLVAGFQDGVLRGIVGI